MKVTLDIPDEALAEIESRFDKEDAPAEGIPVHMIVNWTRDGVPSAHFVSFVRLTARITEPQRIVDTRKRSLPPWAGLAVPYIHIKPGMKHDMESMRESIARGVAMELAESERVE